MKNYSFVVLLLLGAMLVLLQVTWFRPWGWLNMIVHLALLFVIITTIQTTLRTGLVLAVVLGALYQMFSPLSFWVHPVSLAIAVIAAWLIRHRGVTNRTSLSLLVSVIGGTAAYYIVAAGLMTIHTIFNGMVLTPVWSVWVTAAAWQLILHPFLAAVWWILTRQRQGALRINTW